MDTAFIVALIDSRDARAGAAETLTHEFALDGSELVTTDAVLIEIGNYFSRGGYRGQAARWIEAIRGSQKWVTIPLNRPLMDASETRYRRHEDKNWSMTDCISMEVMLQRRIREVATSDHGFAQAGFTVLMR